MARQLPQAALPATLWCGPERGVNRSSGGSRTRRCTRAGGEVGPEIHVQRARRVNVVVRQQRNRVPT